MTVQSSPHLFPQLKRPFPPPSPAKHIRASLRKLGHGKKLPPREGTIPEEAATTVAEGAEPIRNALDKNFGYHKILEPSLSWGKRWGEAILDILAMLKDGKGSSMTYLLLSKSSPRLRLCEGGELLDRILSKGGRYTEEEAKLIVVQILSVVSFCHLQGVVHRDLKPENFLFTSRNEDADVKLIDFGLSDFIRPASIK